MSYPVLIHCNAGLNRTGVMVAVYRMEYQGWSRAEAFRDTLDNGFGRTQGTAANDYIKQYILTYQPGGLRQPEGRAEIRSQKSEVSGRKIVTVWSPPDDAGQRQKTRAAPFRLLTSDP